MIVVCAHENSAVCDRSGANARPNYMRPPYLADALLYRFTRAETQKLLGGNYARAFAATLG
jgi:hypothetical protein